MASSRSLNNVRKASGSVTSVAPGGVESKWMASTSLSYKSSNSRVWPSCCCAPSRTMPATVSRLTETVAGIVRDGAQQHEGQTRELLDLYDKLVEAIHLLSTPPG